MPISISIHAGPDTGSSTVTASGNVQHIITDSERTAFNIQDASLKNAVNSYFGQAPDDAFLHDPNQWNLYATYGWTPVQTLLSVQSATILGVTSEPSIIASQIFENQSSVPAEFNCGITQDVNVTTESNWSDTTAVEIGQTISYDISFLGSGAGGETSFTYSESWEKGGSESHAVTLGTSSGVTVTLQPGESVNSELTASKGVLKVQLVYQLSLIPGGVTAVHYNHRYNGHYFYWVGLLACMAFAKLPASITTTETIEIDFYANSKIVLKNPDGQIIETFLMGVKPLVMAEAVAK